jgi:hypothetical protein
VKGVQRYLRPEGIAEIVDIVPELECDRRRRRRREEQKLPAMHQGDVTGQRQRYREVRLSADDGEGQR